jgi:hypothetical protein
MDGKDVTTTGLDLVNGTASEAMIVVADDGGTVTGEVLNAAGRGMPLVQVSLNLVGGTPAETQLRGKLAKTAARGFVFCGVAPGRYVVSVKEFGLPASQSREVEVRAGTLTQVSLE